MSFALGRTDALWLDAPSRSLGDISYGTVRGTSGDDALAAARLTDTVVDLGGGNDTLTVTGAGVFTVRNVERVVALGSGNQTVRVAADAPVGDRSAVDLAVRADLGGGTLDTVELDGRNVGRFRLLLSGVERVFETSAAATELVLGTEFASNGPSFWLGRTDTLWTGSARQALGDVSGGLVRGTDADDRLTLGKATGTVDLGGGDDVLVLKDTSTVVVRNVERVEGVGATAQDVTVDGGGRVVLALGAGHDTVRLVGDRTVEVAQVEAVTGDAGDQDVLVSAPATVSLALGGGRDRVTVMGSGARLTLGGVEALRVLPTDDRPPEVFLAASVTDGTDIDLGGTGVLRLRAPVNRLGAVLAERVVGQGDDHLTLRSASMVVDLGAGIDTVGLTGGHVRVANVEHMLAWGGDQTFEDHGGAPGVPMSASLGDGEDTVAFLRGGDRRIALTGVEHVRNASGEAATLALLNDGGGANLHAFDMVSLAQGASVLGRVEGASDAFRLVGSAGDDDVVLAAVARGMVDLGDGEDRLSVSEASGLGVAGVEHLAVGAGDDTVRVLSSCLRSLDMGDGDDLAVFAGGLGEMEVAVVGVEAVEVGAGTVLTLTGLGDAPVVLGEGRHVLSLLGAGDWPD